MFDQGKLAELESLLLQRKSLEQEIEELKTYFAQQANEDEEIKGSFGSIHWYSQISYHQSLIPLLKARGLEEAISVRPIIKATVVREKIEDGTLSQELVSPYQKRSIIWKLSQERN